MRQKSFRKLFYYTEDPLHMEYKRRFWKYKIKYPSEATTIAYTFTDRFLTKDKYNVEITSKTRAMKGIIERARNQRQN